MKCTNPDCGAENPVGNKFCENCGSPLPAQSPVLPPRPVGNPLSSVINIGSITAMTGGGVTILGWLLPWFSLGGIIGSVLRFLDIGGGLPINIGSGVGNGLQLTVFAFLAGIAGFSDSDTVLLGLFAMLIALVLVIIPIIGIRSIRFGIKLMEAKSGASSEALPASKARVNETLQTLRSNATVVFVIMISIFLLFSIIPFASAVLSTGFYLTILGPICIYGGAFYAQSKLRTIPG